MILFTKYLKKKKIIFAASFINHILCYNKLSIDLWKIWYQSDLHFTGFNINTYRDEKTVYFDPHLLLGTGYLDNFTRIISTSMKQIETISIKPVWLYELIDASNLSKPLIEYTEGFTHVKTAYFAIYYFLRLTFCIIIYEN